ncbi:MAG: SprT-like domain-containing protein [Bdellovibrionota bacterium]
MIDLVWFEKILKGSSRTISQIGEQLRLFPTTTNTQRKNPLHHTTKSSKHLHEKKRPRTTPAGRNHKSSLIKSDPHLARIWESLIVEYFPNEPRLREYRVIWSKRRQLRTLASCNIDSLRVRVAQELDHPSYHCWLAPLLYHEMCHAVLGDSVRQKGEKARWHGPEFRALEKRHSEIPGLDQWIRSGGWSSAVRSHRAREAHAKRRAQGS